MSGGDQRDLDGDGREELLLGGVNNGNHQATLVVLDPLQVVGASTPTELSDHRFQLLNMQSAKEKAVIFFPRSCISSGQQYTRVSRLAVSQERIVVDVAESVNERDPGFVYEFDYGLHVINVTPTGAQTLQRHQDLEAIGKLDHHFDLEKECARLRAEVVVQRRN